MTDTRSERTRKSLAAGLALAAVLGLEAAAAGVQEIPTGPAARDFLALACAPSAARSAPQALGHVVGGTDLDRDLFGPGDSLIVEVPEEALEIGRRYYVRRALPPLDHGGRGEDRWLNIHTRGWVRVDRVETGRIIAVVEHACDAVETGDYLAAFEAPVVPEPLDDVGEPDFDDPGRVLFGHERTSIYGAGSLLAIDRGSDHGARPGQRLTFYRRNGSPGEPFAVLGDGMVLFTTPESSTVRVLRAVEAIVVDDLVALHR